MDTALNTLESLFHEKILLYRELVESLKVERTFIIETDMDKLWDISDKKQAIVSGIENVRRNILEALSQAQLKHDMDVPNFSLASVMSLIPHEKRTHFRQAYLSLVQLKSETQQWSMENKAFVEQSIHFLDELICIIADSGEPNSGYNNGGYGKQKGPSNLLLSREV